MVRELDPAALDLKGIVKPGDHVVWGQATGEPQTLTETLVRQRRELGNVNVFIGSCFSRTLQPEHTDRIRIAGFGGIGNASELTKGGAMEIVPCHVGQIARYIADRRIGCDVAFVQVSPPDPDGRHSFGVIHDYIPTAAAVARVVVAEMNDQVPWTLGSRSLGADDIDFLVPTSRSVLEVKPAIVGDIERTIARHASGFIGDGAVLQVGIGGIPDAIMQSIADRKDLGLHSGMVGDALVNLVECGALTNACKPIDHGISVAGALIGTRRLYEFAHRNSSLMMRESAYTHGEAILAKLDRLISINSAIEVDLTGQVNAEVVGASYVGATGGQVDFVRAGHRSPGGRSIIAFASTAKGDEISRICSRLSGPVTTARSEVDVIVTEYGAADLRSQPLRERARRLIEIAHPKFRETLERDAGELLRRGY
jgi:acyl-CoA hydrolase